MESAGCIHPGGMAWRYGVFPLSNLQTGLGAALETRLGEDFA
jgi:hypothetical protein